MKYLFLFTLLSVPILAMELVPAAADIVSKVSKQEVKVKVHSSVELAKKLSQVIDLFGEDPNITEEQEQFRWLALQYLSHQSQTAADNVTPILREKLRISHESLEELLNQSDRRQLLRYVHNMITESIEDAFKRKDKDYLQLQAEAELRVRKTKIALLVSVIGGVSGILAAFFGAYFGH